MRCYSTARAQSRGLGRVGSSGKLHMTHGMRIATIVVGVASLCGVAALVLRPSPPSVELPPGRARAKTSERVRERLNQLRSDRPDAHEALGAIGQPAVPAAGAPRSAGGTTDFLPHGGRIEPRDALAAEAHGSTNPSVAQPDEDPPTLKKMALEDPDPDRRLAAIALLATTDDPDAPAILSQALSDRNDEVRMAALEALSDFTSEPPVDAIEDALRDPSPDIRFEALSVLADVGGERAHNAIERALTDPDDDVRALAEGILDLESPTGTAAEHPHRLR